MSWICCQGVLAYCLFKLIILNRNAPNFYLRKYWNFTHSNMYNTQFTSIGKQWQCTVFLNPEWLSLRGVDFPHWLYLFLQQQLDKYWNKVYFWKLKHNRAIIHTGKRLVQMSLGIKNAVLVTDGWGGEVTKISSSCANDHHLSCCGCHNNEIATDGLQFAPNVNSLSFRHPPVTRLMSFF